MPSGAGSHAPPTLRTSRPPQASHLAKHDWHHSLTPSSFALATSNQGNNSTINVASAAHISVHAGSCDHAVHLIVADPSQPRASSRNSETMTMASFARQGSSYVDDALYVDAIAPYHESHIIDGSDHFSLAPRAVAGTGLQALEAEWGRAPGFIDMPDSFHPEYGDYGHTSSALDASLQGALGGQVAIPSSAPDQSSRRVSMLGRASFHPSVSLHAVVNGNASLQPAMQQRLAATSRTAPPAHSYGHAAAIAHRGNPASIRASTRQSPETAAFVNDSDSFGHTDVAVESSLRAALTGGL